MGPNSCIGCQTNLGVEWRALFSVLEARMPSSALIFFFFWGGGLGSLIKQRHPLESQLIPRLLGNLGRGLKRLQPVCKYRVQSLGSRV